jgi:hypothetical protein
MILVLFIAWAELVGDSIIPVASQGVPLLGYERVDGSHTLFIQRCCPKAHACIVKSIEKGERARIARDMLQVVFHNDRLVMVLLYSCVCRFDNICFTIIQVLRKVIDIA